MNKRARHPASIAALRGRIRAIEGRSSGWDRNDEYGDNGSATGARADAPVSLAPEIDRALPWGGLARGGLHEIIAGDTGTGNPGTGNPGTGDLGGHDFGGGASGFAAWLLGRLAAKRRAVLWCETARTLDAGRLYPPGLAAFGLDPARLVLVRARNAEQALWTLEEALRSPALAAALAEIGPASLTATRRLQLAAESSGVTALLLRPARMALDGRKAMGGSSAALTRWRIAAAPGGRRWRADLLRCRGGAPGNWTMEWRDETHDLAVAAPVHDRSSVPWPARLAG